MMIKKKACRDAHAPTSSTPEFNLREIGRKVRKIEEMTRECDCGDYDIGVHAVSLYTDIYARLVSLEVWMEQTDKFSRCDCFHDFGCANA